MIRIRAGCMPQHSDLIVLTPVFKGDDGGDPRSCGYIASTAHVRKMACSSCVVNRETVSKNGPRCPRCGRSDGFQRIGPSETPDPFCRTKCNDGQLGEVYLEGVAERNLQESGFWRSCCVAEAHHS